MSESNISKHVPSINFDMERRPEASKPAPASGPVAPEDASLKSLQQECDSMRRLMVLVLLVMLVFTGSVNLFMLRQMGTVRKDLEMVRPQVQQLLNQHNERAPHIEQFVGRLVEFGKSYPDFNQVLAKYGLSPQAQPAQGPPAQPAAPAQP